ncbi:hypothetical protein L6452_34056 [Arctium lappa]|uniref:Uncharacterized protein n=1 Tax=Arctium lappa TaxID=4217 RepID=A0ACB8YHQ5_ARCLA|nr:hypothetical protein L6452_34056 [Arctium lappa]
MAEVFDLPSEVFSNLCTKSCIDTVKRYRDHNQSMCDELKRLEKDRKDCVLIVERFEEQIKGFQANELQHSYDTNYWKWEKNELETKLSKSKEENDKLKEELDKVKLDIEKFSYASKTMDSLLKAQIHDKMKSGVGYNNTPPPYNNNYIPPTLDLLETKEKKDLSEKAFKIDPLDEVVVKDLTKKEASENRNNADSAANSNTAATSVSTAENINASNTVSTSSKVTTADTVTTSNKVNTSKHASTANAVSSSKTSTASSKCAAKPIIVTKYSSNEESKFKNLGNQQLKGKIIWHVDSGCSRHMTGNMSCLQDYKHINRGHVAFGQEHSSSMATMAFIDEHNEIAMLQKPTQAEGFYQIVDFLRTSHIAHALTVSPTIYIEHQRQFWANATTSTDNGVSCIKTRVCDKPLKVTEETIRICLRLDDVSDISSIPNEDLFSNLTRMGKLLVGANLAVQLPMHWYVYPLLENTIFL